MADETPTDTTDGQETPPACLSCSKPATWQSPTGHHLCEECRAAYDRRFPPTSDTLAELLERDLEPIRWTVEDMIPEGLTFLAGKPKLGKSWLALVLALSVATGGKFLGYRTVTGSVLYIALEDGERRMQERAIWLGARNMNEGLDQFHYRMDWPPLTQGGIDHLQQWMTDYPQTRLIVIDTFGRIRGDLPGRDRYAEEYGLLGALQGFAIGHGIAVVCIHHLRKMGADDWIEQLSGSQAITGAADTLLGLYRDRGQADAVLRTVSRDVDELELALQFNDGRWAYMGPAADYRHTVERTAVLEALKDLGGEGRVADIAQLVEKSSANTSKLLVGLVEEGAVRRVKHGLYSMVEVVEKLKNTPSISTIQPNQPHHIKEEGFSFLADSSISTIADEDYEPDLDELPNPFGDDL